MHRALGFDFLHHRTILLGVLRRSEKIEYETLLEIDYLACISTISPSLR